MKTAPLKQRRQVASRFRKLRKRFNLTQTQLAKLIDLDRTNISWIENAKRHPYHSTMKRFEELEHRLEQGQQLHASSR